VTGGRKGEKNPGARIRQGGGKLKCDEKREGQWEDLSMLEHHWEATLPFDKDIWEERWGALQREQFAKTHLEGVAKLSERWRVHKGRSNLEGDGSVVPRKEKRNAWADDNLRSKGVAGLPKVG